MIKPTTNPHRSPIAPAIQGDHERAEPHRADRRRDTPLPYLGPRHSSALLQRYPAVRAGVLILLGGYEPRRLCRAAHPARIARGGAALPVDECLAVAVRGGAAKQVG